MLYIKSVSEEANNITFFYQNHHIDPKKLIEVLFSVVFFTFAMNVYKSIM